MERNQVSSSDIRSIGYDSPTTTLEIEFISGGVYRYSNVPENVFNALMSAGSHGQYFHSYIKDNYSCERV